MSHASRMHLVGECKFTHIGSAERCSFFVYFPSLGGMEGFPVGIAATSGLGYVRKMRGEDGGGDQPYKAQQGVHGG